jgi:hypothetical protein
MVSDGACLVELATSDTELLKEEPCPSKKHLQKSKCLLERQERREWLDARVAEEYFDAGDFWYVNYLFLLQDNIFIL